MAPPSDLQHETVTAPTNIACIKYWGKASKEFNTPINSSVSVTLDQDDLRAITSVCASKSFTSDRLWLNGSELAMATSENEHAERFKTCVREMRARARDRVDPSTGAVLVRASEWSEYHIHVVSRNTFPTAAGLASSAAGYACLVFAIAKLFGIPSDDVQGLADLSVVARQGSGSACRSLFGGFVKWQMGTSTAGWLDSRAVPVAPKEAWPDLEALILVVNDAKKDTSSTAGMGASVATSPLLMLRAKHVVDGRMDAIEKAFKAQDFAAFGDLIMADSNQFHATCLDTLPPIFYLNDTSRQVIRLVHAFNAHHGATIAAYTFDAGPNAVIFVPKMHHAALTAFMLHFFPKPTHENLAAFTNRPDLLSAASKAHLPPALVKAGAATGRVPACGDIKMVYCTRIGGGPRHLTYTDPSACLLDLQSGLPKPAPPAAAAAPQASASGGAAAGAATSKDKSEMAKLTEAVAELNAKEEERHATLMAQVKSFNWVNDAAKFAALYGVFYMGIEVISSLASKSKK